MLRQTGTAFGLALAGLLLGGMTRADPIYSFAFDQANYSVAPGGTVDVQVFLQEVLMPRDTSLLATAGLIGAGVLVDFSDPTPTQPAQVLSLADVFPNDLANGGPFDGPSAVLFTPGVGAGFTESVDLATPPVTATGGGPVFAIFLGTLRFTAGAAPGEVTQVQATRTAPASSDNVGGDLPPTVLDDDILPGTATITVRGAAVVPEPAGLALAAVGLLGLLGARRRTK
jgi:hypothetical protein